MRLFIALPLPHALQQELDLWWERQSGLMPEWRTVAAGNRHLTLHFLGEMDGGKLDELADILDQLFAETSAMQLSINGVGFFPTPARARTFWVGVDEEAGLLAGCARRCRHLCQAVQARSGQSTPFRAHITMARHSTAMNGVELVEQLVKPPVFNWLADEVQLIQSHLQPHGPSYQIIERFSLGGGA